MKNNIKLLIVMALPIIGQEFIHSSLGFIDTVMVGQLGESEVAAIGIAGQIVFIFFIIQFGLQSGISVNSAKYWGRGDIKSFNNQLGAGGILALFTTVICTFICYIFSEGIMLLFTNDQDVVKYGVKYLRVVSLSFVFTSLTYLFTFSLRSCEVLKAPLIASIISAILNIIFNYVLIFGKWGFKPMGIEGAAVATSLSRILSAIFLIVVIYQKKYPSAVSVRDMLSFSIRFFIKALKTSIPVLFHELMWVGGISVYLLIYSKLGTKALAAFNLATSLEKFIMTPFYGMFAAGAIIIGNKIGEGRVDSVYSISRALLLLQSIFAAIVSLTVILFRFQLTSLYNVSDLTSIYLEKLIIVVGIILTFKVINYTLAAGILRGGGDTKVSLYIESSGIWLIGIPLAFLGVYYLNLPIYLLVLLVLIEELYKFIFGFKRFKSRKWIKSI